MSSIGTGYDYSATTFSPDGRIFQLEYAAKAVDNSGNAIGIQCKDGIVLGVEKLMQSKLLIPNANRRIGTADLHIGIATSGLIADGRHLVNRGKQEAAEYRKLIHDDIPPKYFVDRLSMFVQAYTLYSSVRPFGTSAIIGIVHKKVPKLYMIEPSGVYWGYYGVAIGKGRQNAKTEIEKLKFDELTCKDAVKEIARIIYFVHDDAKDKDFELEISWICPQSNYVHEFVPKDILDAAIKHAKDALNSEMDAD